MTSKTKKIIVILTIVLFSFIGLVSLGIAYAGGVRGIGLVGVFFFVTFGVAVVLAQLIPAGIMLASFIGTIFSSTKKGEMPVRTA